MRILTLTSLCVTLSIALGACASVSEKIPTVKIERKKPKAVQHVTYVEPVAPTVQRAEAAMVCDNANMRARAYDGNSSNDSARILVMEESDRSNTIIADVEVNCRDYFQSAAYRSPVISTGTNYETIPAAPAPTPVRYEAPPVPSPKPRRTYIQPEATPIKAAEGYFYAIKKGDTLYAIARENCTSVKAISQLNNITDPTTIDRGQILRLPSAKCDKR